MMAVSRFGGRRTLFHHPAQYIVAAFAGTILVGTLFLLLPAATRTRDSPPFVTALFTSTSATCITGLSLEDTSTYWSGFGQAVILVLVQVGGLGIMTMTSLLVIVLSRKLGLRQRLIAAAQTGGTRLGDVRELLGKIIKYTVIVETAVAVVLTLRFLTTYDEPFGRAVYHGVFHAISAFNNAGFALFPDSLISLQSDPLVMLVVAMAIITGGLGFPVWRQIIELPRQPRKWNLHTQITVITTIALLAVGTVLFIWFEWTNPATLGPLSTLDKAINGFFQSVTTRSAGFHTVDIVNLNDASHLLTIILMFIGAGSGSTGGGIKVSTFALLGWVMWADLRGERDVVALRRRVPNDIQRQAVTVVLLAVGGVVVSTMFVLAFSPFELTESLFEVVSALGTTGLSFGITPLLPIEAEVLVAILMFVGRIGPPTLFTALVLRNRERLYRYPEERIIIG